MPDQTAAHAALTPERAGRERFDPFPYLLVLPALLILAVVFLYPLAYSLWLSFFNLNLNRPGRGMPFVGFGNYEQVLTDPDFYHALWLTVYWSVGSVAGQVLLGMAAALALNETFPGRAIARAVILVPWAVPTVLVAIVFNTMFNTQGIINQLLLDAHIVGSYVGSWLSSSAVDADDHHRQCVERLSVRRGELLAGLQGIPGELYEAAKMDGATDIEQFRFITLPSLRPVMAVTVLLSIIFSLKSVDFQYIMTYGGPADSTKVVAFEAYYTAFGEFLFGKASAIATILTLITAAISYLYLKGGAIYRRGDGPRRADRGARPVEPSAARHRADAPQAHPAVVCHHLLCRDRARAVRLDDLSVVQAGRRGLFEDRGYPAVTRPDARKLHLDLPVHPVPTLFPQQRHRRGGDDNRFDHGLPGARRLRLSRVFRFRGRSAIAFLILATQMFPLVTGIIPLYLVFAKLGLIDSRLGAAFISMCVQAIPFCTWMLKGFFDNIPREIEEASTIDGCSRLQTLAIIVLPISVPAILATCVFCFILSWNEFLYAAVFTSSDAVKTLPAALGGLVGQGYTQWGSLNAAGVMTTLPVVIGFLTFQRYLVSGLTAGAMKG